MKFWAKWLGAAGLLRTQREGNYYDSGRAAQDEGAYANAVQRIHQALPPDQRTDFYADLAAAGFLPSGTDASYWGEERFSGGENDDLAHVGAEVERRAPTAHPDAAAPTSAPARTTGPATTPAPSVGETVTMGNRTVPPGAHLLVVRPTQGGAEQYFFRYNVGTAEQPFMWLFSVGTKEDFNREFGDPSIATEVITDRAFNASDEFGMVMGTVDELPVDESLTTQLNRELALAGLEQIPDWIRNDRQAMVWLSTSTREGWSQGRLWNQLENTQGYRERFRGAQTIATQMGLSSPQEIAAQHVRLEGELRTLLRSYRGPSADFSEEYVVSLVQRGWTPGEAEERLEGEQILRRNPEAFRQFQELVPGATEDDFLAVRSGSADDEMLEAINRAVLAAELESQGVEVDRILAESLDVPEGEVLPEGAFEETAIQVARAIHSALPDVVSERFGITRADITRALVNRDATGLDLLSQLSRERTVAGEGLGGVSSFIDARSRLRVQGTANI